MDRRRRPRDRYRYEKKENAFFGGKNGRKPIILHLIVALIILVVLFLAYMSLKTCELIIF